MTCTGGWEGKEKLQKTSGWCLSFPSHPFQPFPSSQKPTGSQGVLPGAPAGFAGLGNFVEKQNPPGYQEQQMAPRHCAGLASSGVDVTFCVWCCLEISLIPNLQRLLHSLRDLSKIWWYKCAPGPFAVMVHQCWVGGLLFCCDCAGFFHNFYIQLFIQN